jgi:hypothetical protein
VLRGLDTRFSAQERVCSATVALIPKEERESFGIKISGFFRAKTSANTEKNT